MYVLQDPGNPSVNREYVTPDEAFFQAKKLSKFSTIIVRSGKGMNSSVKVIAWCGHLYQPKVCKDCDGSGKPAISWSSSSPSVCIECFGAGHVRGEAIL